MTNVLLLEENDRKILKQTRDLLEELLETVEISSSQESMKKLEEAKDDVKKGRVRKFL